MGIDFEALRGEVGGDPPDGVYNATLQRAKLVDTRNGEMLVTEWQVDDPGPYYWTAWHGFEPNRMSWTQEYLDGLGVDRGKLTDEDELTDALNAVLGERFELRTEVKSGFLNTYVEGPATGSGTQTSLDDVPIDAADFEPARVADGPPDPDDDDIPF